MDANGWGVVLGAVAAILGGVMAELWSEARRNLADVRTLIGNIEGFVSACERLRTAEPHLSVALFLPTLELYAQHAGNSTGWLQCVTDVEDRRAVFAMISRIAELRIKIAYLVEIEEAVDAPSRAVVRLRHRRLANEGVEIVSKLAGEVLPRLRRIESRPLPMMLP